MEEEFALDRADLRDERASWASSCSVCGCFGEWMSVASVH
jgi:hypothetical protein